MTQNLERTDRRGRRDSDSPPAPARKPVGHHRFALLIRVALSVATIVILMLWILGAFRHGVIQAEVRPISRRT